MTLLKYIEIINYKDINQKKSQEKRRKEKMFFNRNGLTAETKKTIVKN